MGRFILLLALSLNFAYAQDDYYADEPVDNYDAYDQPASDLPLPQTKEIKPYAPQMEENFNEPPENFDAPEAQDYPVEEPYPEDPYPVNEDTSYEDSY